VFQVKKIGWKRLAAGVLLLPGFIGLGAAILTEWDDVQAQNYPSSDKTEIARGLMVRARSAFDKGDYSTARELAETARTMLPGRAAGTDSPDVLLAEIQRIAGSRSNVPTPNRSTKEDPRTLVKRAREALNRGSYEMAQDLAQQAEANGRTISWGLFEDSPSAIYKDLQKVRGKQGKVEADRLVLQARALLNSSKGKATDIQRATYLEQARSMCLQAIQANGNSSMFDMGDNPQTLLKEIDSARAKLDPAAVNRVATTGRPFNVAGDQQLDPAVKPADSRDVQVAQNPLPVRPQVTQLRPMPRFSEANQNTPLTSPEPDSNPIEKVSAEEGFPGGVTVSKSKNPIGWNGEAPMSPDELPSGVVVSKPGNGPGWKPEPKTPIDKAPLENHFSPPTSVTPPTDHGSPKNQIVQNVPVASPPVEQKSPLVQNVPVVSPPVEQKSPPPAVDLTKVKAIQQMKQASAFQKGGHFVEARACLMAAAKYEAEFNYDEETPEMELQSLMASARAHINGMCAEAGKLIAKQTDADLAEADRKLIGAEDIARGLGLDRWAINEHRAMMQAKHGQAATAEKPPVKQEPMTNPLVKEPAVAIKKEPQEPREMPNFPPKEQLVVQPKESLILPPMETVDPQVMQLIPPREPIVAKPIDTNDPSRLPIFPPVEAEKPVVNQGYEMLKQAHEELKRNQLDTARKIAGQVLNGPFEYKDEALELIRTIDAEELLQKKKTALVSYERGVEAYQNKHFEQAFQIFKLIDPMLLPAGKKTVMVQYLADARTASTEKSPPVAQVNTPKSKKDPVPPVTPAVSSETSGADNLLKQQESMRELQFQKLRSEGLQLEASATARFGKGETDAAMADLNGFINRVKTSNIDPAKVSMLVRPVENRIERLKVLKHQQDFLTKEAKDLREFRTSMSQDALHTAHKKEEVAKLMKEFNRLTHDGKYQEAGKVALQARELDPEDPIPQAAMHMNRTMYRKDAFEKSRANSEEWNWKTGHDNLNLGPTVTPDDPVKFDLDAFNRIRNRSDTSGGVSAPLPKSEAERRIESKLSTTVVDINFKGTPLDEVINYLMVSTGLNFDLDTRALDADHIDTKTPINSTLNKITLKSALEIILMKANLRYVVDKEVVRVTTQKGARGKLVQRTMPVADLVIPVQNYVPSAVNNLNERLASTLAMSRPLLPGSASTPFTPAMGLGNQMGTPTGTASLTNTQNRSTGTLQNSPTTGTSKQWATGTIEESLIRLITNSVQPDSWEAMGGPGRIEYYPLGMALVINQTPDVIEEVIRLLEALRALQDLEIAIEVRMITLAETFYERIGLDFSMNIKTNTKDIEPALTTGIFRPAPFVNDNNLKSKVLGLQAPGILTPDLDIPIRATSFGPSIPPFGNFPNALGADGGISVGLAFLSDIQVQMFLEAAQGDRRTNVMQAPKLTMFNGQSATISINDQQFFLTGITVTSVNGQLVFTPQNQPFPLGVQMFMQPVVSGDRRFVRLNIQQQMTNLASATVPLFPITTIVTPVFEGGSQGQPIPFTQFVQQPTFSSIDVQTTVVVPDGGTVLLGGLKTLSEGRNEFGPPVLSKIPYVSRLFRNVGYGREAQSLMMMVTPRIIINREEEERQTGVSQIPN